jgi:GntR family transcriptional repressor for pyruvate dehydrogenase complex
MLKAVTKKRAYESIVEQIRGLIEKGKLKQGDQLPTEKELSETFKVSRSTVREAVLSLDTMKLVERRQGEGTYVIASSEEAIIQPLAATLLRGKDEIIDVFNLRSVLEPEIAQLASLHATPKTIKRLEEILERQATEIEAGNNPVRSDADFHFALARMAKNKVLERLLVALVGLLAKTREEYLQTEERKHKSLSGHREILAAIQSGNGQVARQAMERHLAAVEKTMFSKGKRRSG